MVLRFDVGRLSRSGSTPTGGARLRANLARTGIQEYRLPDGGKRREYRPASEVFAEDSQESYIGSALTIGHPEGGVSPSTWQKEAAGVALVPERTKLDDGFEYVTAIVDVTRADALGKVDTGELCELSAGYSCDFDPTPGVVPVGEPQAGEKYDGVQRNIRINHVAMLEQGRARAGRNAKFLTDSEDGPDYRLDSDGNQLVSLNTSKAIPLKFLLNGKEYEAGPELQAAIGAFEASVGQVKVEAQTAVATANAKADKAEQDRVAAEAKVPTADAIEARVTEEIAFREKVRPVLDSVDATGKAVPYVFTGKSRKDVQLEVLKKLGAKLKGDEDDLNVNAYFNVYTADGAPVKKSEDYRPAPSTKADADDNWRLDDAKWNAWLHSLHGKDPTALEVK